VIDNGPVRTRDLTADGGGTCDWGGCDRPTVVERYDTDLGWLPVCELHGSRLGRQASPGRGVCPGCGRERAVNTGGTMYAHNSPGGMVRCPGVDQPPTDAPVPRQDELTIEPTWWALPQGRTSHAHRHDPVVGTHRRAVCGAGPVWDGPGWVAEEPGRRRPRCVRCCRILDPDG